MSFIGRIPSDAAEGDDHAVMLASIEFGLDGHERAAIGSVSFRIGALYYKQEYLRSFFRSLLRALRPAVFGAQGAGGGSGGQAA